MKSITGEGFIAFIYQSLWIRLQKEKGPDLIFLKNCKHIIIVNQTITFGKRIYCKKSSSRTVRWGKMFKKDKFRISFSVAVAASPFISYFNFGRFHLIFRSNTMLLPKTAANNSKLLVLLSHFLSSSMCSAIVARRQCHCQPLHPVRRAFLFSKSLLARILSKKLKFILRSLLVRRHKFVCNIVAWAFLPLWFRFLYFCFCISVFFVLVTQPLPWQEQFCGGPMWTHVRLSCPSPPICTSN